MTRRLVRVTAGAVGLVALLATGLFGAWGWRELHRPYASWSGGSVVVVLEPGLDAGDMLERLAAAGVIRRPRWVRAWLRATGGGSRLRAGEYAFERPLSPAEVLERLERGEVLLHPVTLPEGLTYREIAERLVQAGFGPRAELVAAFRDPAPVRDLDAQAVDLEGYLFPDTYHFPRQERPARIAQALVARFRELTGPEFVEEAERSGLGLRGAVILASMIEKETGVAGERSRISRVFHNRLARGMRLECDPTVVYALEQLGRAGVVLTYEDLRVVSPWNTYVVQGLPAGPIANPGRASLLAAVRPAAGEEVYFVAAPGGGHRFSADFAEHLRAVAEWRRYRRSSR